MDGSSGTGSNANSFAGPFSSEEYVGQSHRQKADIAWAHVSEGVNAQRRKTMTCIYCHKTFAGGGIFRMKQHLARARGSIVSCGKVPPEVRHAISVTLKDIFEKKKEKRGEFGVEKSFGRSVDEFDGDEVQEIPIIHTKGITINEASASSDKGKNVVHMVTNNASNYKAVGTLLSEKYPTICWSPCAAHCINLILKDIGQMNDVKVIVSLASTVTVFVYNHKYTLNWLRKTKGWKEIIHPGETRFATTFIALKSLHDHKDSLQALVTSGDYKKFLKIDKGKEVKQIVLDEKFWNNCLITVRIMGPLIRLLRVCDIDERPLGYVYEGMYRAINGIKKLFKNKERFYKPYTDIINERWDRMLRKNLHVAAYYLNPAFQYDPSFSTHPEITNGLFDYIESKVDWCSLDVLTYEIGMFRDRQGSFGRKSAILSNQKKSSRTEQPKRSYDPIDYESIDKTDFWVVEETPIGELDYDELEEELEELPVPLESSNFQQFEDDGDEAEPEDVNLDLFQRRSVLVDEDDWI
ncbi:hypothetical protein ZIOFF_057307 [Zingiber officinale]|uniref:BED-type domain-containing protein n=1 Tax=Zingiber officinale TaxID=94328 RepID=A0A8J5KIC9_ZINOF|nr:hypothetical protein ZIOFF_057307 [Zingiber officinale]